MSELNVGVCNHELARNNSISAPHPSSLSTFHPCLRLMQYNGRGALASHVTTQL